MLVKIKQTAHEIRQQIIKTQGELEYAKLMAEFNDYIERWKSNTKYKGNAEDLVGMEINTTKDPQKYQLAVCWLDEHKAGSWFWIFRTDGVSIKELMREGFFSYNLEL